MARQSKKGSILEIAIFGNWKVSASLSIFVCAIIFFVIPSVSNPLLKPIAFELRPPGLFLAAIFGIIALVKFLLQKNLKIQSSSIVRSNINAPSAALIPAFKPPIASLFENTPPKRPTDWSLKLIQDIEWKKFEELSTAYYQEKGIRAEATSLGADGGIDIKLYQDHTGYPTTIVQCKSWSSKQVGVKEIREFLGVMTHEKIAKGFYMTSGAYSTDAKETAATNRITLINGEMLLAMIKRLPLLSQQKLLTSATMGDYTTPTCSSCGVKMVKRSGKRGEFWGCRNYPGCKQMLHLKSTKL